MSYQTDTKEPIARVGTKHQVVIPKKIFQKFNLQAGDLIEFGIDGQKITLAPKQLIYKTLVPNLNKKEQSILIKAKKKIDKINTDMINSKGLDYKEIRVAVKAGLINDDQKWWWHEDWQKGEQEAERDIAEENYKDFDNVEDLIKDLNS